MFFLGYLSSALESLFTGYLSLTGEPHYMLPIPHFRAFLTGYLSSTRKAFSYYATYLLLESLFTGCWEQKEPFNVPFWEETNNEKADLLEELRKKTNLSVLNYKKKSETNGTFLFRGENKTFKLKVFSDNKNLITMALIFLSTCKVHFEKFPWWAGTKWSKLLLTLAVWNVILQLSLILKTKETMQFYVAF